MMGLFADQRDVEQAIGGFLAEFPRLDPIFREVTDGAELTLKLELKAPEWAVEIDLASRPLVVKPGSESTGAVAMSGLADEFHRVLLGLTPVGIAINHKKLLARGPTSKLMQVTPLLYLAPYIYPFYLASIGRTDLVQDGGLIPLHGERQTEGIMNKLAAAAAFMAGYCLGVVKRLISPDLDILSALEAMGKGLKKGFGKGSAAK